MTLPHPPSDRPGDQDGRGGRDRPIIFSGPMITALLAGRKTQTRRIVKRPMDHFHGSYTHLHQEGGRFVWSDGTSRPECLRVAKVPCAVGDRLWVKEAARRSPEAWAYAADGTPVAWPGRGDLAGRKRDICNSLFLPRSCSRLTLIVETVKVERLQDISETDAEAEGCDFDVWDQALAVRDYSSPDGWFCGWGTMEGEPGYVPEERIWRESYRTLWTSIHGPDAWDANPWVAALTFRAIPRNIDSLSPTPTGEDGAVPHLTTEQER